MMSKIFASDRHTTTIGQKFATYSAMSQCQGRDDDFLGKSMRCKRYVIDNDFCFIHKDQKGKYSRIAYDRDYVFVEPPAPENAPKGIITRWSIKGVEIYDLMKDLRLAGYAVLDSVVDIRIYEMEIDVLTILTKAFKQFLASFYPSLHAEEVAEKV